MEYLKQVMLRQTVLAAAAHREAAEAVHEQLAEVLPGADGLTQTAGGADDGAQRAGPEAAAPEDMAGSLLGELKQAAQARAALEALRQEAVQTRAVRQVRPAATEKADGVMGGAVTQSWTQLRTAGIAGAQTERSMAEISRFFERDARRYGG